jgi:hypothetical protein
MIYLLRDGVQRHSTICHGLLIVSSTLKIAPQAQSLHALRYGVKIGSLKLWRRPTAGVASGGQQLIFF